MSLFFLICSWLHNILIQGKYQTSYIFEITYGCSINNDTENSWLLTFSRFTGSLNAESMPSLVGTIFHFGMMSSTCVRRVITTGCGFTFSDICSFADNPRFSNPQQKGYIHGSSLWMYDTAPCTLVPQGRHHPKRSDPSCAAVEQRLLPWTHRTRTGFCFCNPPWLQKRLPNVSYKL